MRKRLGTFKRQKTRDKDASKTAPKHFNLPGHSPEYVTVYGISPHQSNTERYKNSEQKFILQLEALASHRVIKLFSFNRFIHVFSVAMPAPAV